jgi:AraC family transcriptional regulator
MENNICQSCGMPLQELSQFGTDENGFKIEDYCAYCFKDGKFTSDVTMDGMIEICLKYIQGNKQEEAVTHLRQKLPNLKRWAQKDNTQNEYHKSINKVLDYINDHLNEKPSLARLSEIANISAFHFHRIFKAIIGENLGEYIQRIRLEYVANQLQTNNTPLSILADKTGYNNTQALSKAFKKHFGESPTAYKNKQKHKQKLSDTIELKPKIKEIKNKTVVYIRIIEQYGTVELYKKTWQELYKFVHQHDLFDHNNEFLGISLDNPSVTTPNKCRYYACISINKPFKAEGKFGIQTIRQGLYAIFIQKGSYDGLNDLYKQIWFNWLPTSGYHLRKAVYFEKYINNPDTTKEEDLLTEIYIPISPIK